MTARNSVTSLRKLCNSCMRLPRCASMQSTKFRRSSRSAMRATNCALASCQERTTLTRRRLCTIAPPEIARQIDDGSVDCVGSLLLSELGEQLADQAPQFGKLSRNLTDATAIHHEAYL